MVTMVQRTPRARKQVVHAAKIKKPDNSFSSYVEMVEKKAYELYEQRGRQHGYDQDDWYEAERLVEESMIQGK